MHHPIGTKLRTTRPAAPPLDGVGLVVIVVANLPGGWNTLSYEDGRLVETMGHRVGWQCDINAPFNLWEIVEEAPVIPETYTLAYIRPDGSAKIVSGEYDTLDHARAIANQEVGAGNFWSEVHIVPLRSIGKVTPGGGFEDYRVGA